MLPPINLAFEMSRNNLYFLAANKTRFLFYFNIIHFSEFHCQNPAANPGRLRRRTCPPGIERRAAEVAMDAVRHHHIRNPARRIGIRLPQDGNRGRSRINRLIIDFFANKAFISRHCTQVHLVFLKFAS